MIALGLLQKIQIKLGGAGVIQTLASYVDLDTSTKFWSGVTTVRVPTAGAAAQDLVVAPTGNTRRELKHFFTQNSLGSTVVFTFRYNDNGTSIDWSVSLDPGDMLIYEDAAGWQCFDSTGALKGSSGGGGGSSVVVTEVDGVPTFAASTLQFPNGSVTNLGAGVAGITFTAGGSGADLLSPLML